MIIPLSIASCLILLGCSFQTWYKEEYIDERIKKVYVGSDTLPDKRKYADYYLNGSFVKAGIEAHNASGQSGSSPYRLRVIAFGKKGLHQSIIVRNITIHSNIKCGEYYKYEDNVFPYKCNYDIRNINDENDKITCAEFGYYTKYNLDLSFNEHEEIEALLDIEVHTNEKFERRIIRYKFAPKLEKGIKGLLISK